MTDTLANSYSRRWFDSFHANIPEERTAREVAFICQCAPRPDFQNVLDVGCGMGRHSRALAARHYTVTGLERDEGALTRAREMAGGPRYVQADVRNYEPERSTYDLAIVMSQSFGYFDPATNQSVLQRLARAIREGGRIILDLWNPEFFVAHQGDRDLETDAGIVRERKHVEEGRLFVELIYPDGVEENFGWQLFRPAEIQSLAQSLGLGCLLSCTEFDPSKHPARDNPRIQFVLEQPRSGAAKS